jgi:hypothetical protein
MLILLAIRFWGYSWTYWWQNDWCLIYHCLPYTINEMPNNYIHQTARSAAALRGSSLVPLVMLGLDGYRH